MGSGNVKSKKPLIIAVDEEDSIDSLECVEKIQAIMFNDNEELSKHDDLLAQAFFCDLPPVPSHLFRFESSIALSSSIPPPP
jgi:hypothetical protein